MGESLFESELCMRCKGRGYCGKACKVMIKLKEFLPKPKLHFSGSSPPEVFVGRYNYPQIYSGILSPEVYGKNEKYSMPESWYKNNLSIKQILGFRGRLIYGRFKTHVKKARGSFLGPGKKFESVMKEVAMASKSVSSEFFLKKKPRFGFETDKSLSSVWNPAPIKSVRLEENPKIEKKVDYLVSDTEAKSVTGMVELYKSGIETSNIIKILSAGLLGTGTRRKLVPTRWSITATDDTLSKELLKKIKYYKEISEIMVFHGYYVGNHYEFILLPDKFSFEVIEAYMPGSVWNRVGGASFSQDYEGFSGRKKYASNVTGAYYTARLALAEYLERVKKQASCLVMREERPEYNAPLGVGILRELGRDIFKKKPEKFNSIEEALNVSQKRMKLPVKEFKQKSWLLENYGKQKRLIEFI